MFTKFKIKNLFKKYCEEKFPEHANFLNILEFIKIAYANNDEFKDMAFCFVKK